MESGLFCSLSDVTGAPLLWSQSHTQRMNHINKSHLCIALQLSWGQPVAFELLKPENVASFKQSRWCWRIRALRRAFRDASQVLCIDWINMPLLILGVCESEPERFFFALLSVLKRVFNYKGSSYFSSCWLILFLNDGSMNAYILRKQ